MDLTPLNERAPEGHRPGEKKAESPEVTSSSPVADEVASTRSDMGGILFEETDDSGQATAESPGEETPLSEEGDASSNASDDDEEPLILKGSDDDSEGPMLVPGLEDDEEEVSPETDSGGNDPGGPAEGGGGGNGEGGNEDGNEEQPEDDDNGAAASRTARSSAPLHKNLPESGKPLRGFRKFLGRNHRAANPVPTVRTGRSCLVSFRCLSQCGMVPKALVVGIWWWRFGSCIVGSRGAVTHSWRSARSCMAPRKASATGIRLQQR